MLLVYPPRDDGSNESEISLSQQYYLDEISTPAVKDSTCDWCGGTGDDDGELIFCARCQGTGVI